MTSPVSIPRRCSSALLHALLQELGYRRLPALGLNLDPGHALRTKYFNKIDQIIQFFS